MVDDMRYTDAARRKQHMQLLQRIYRVDRR